MVGVSIIIIVIALLRLLFWLFLATLVVLGVMLLAGLKRRGRNAVLKLLDSFKVTIVWEDGTRRSGRMRVHDKAISLDSDSHQTAANATWLQYTPEWAFMTGIYRFKDSLSEDDLNRRMAQLEDLRQKIAHRKRFQPGRWLDKLADEGFAWWASLHGRSFPQVTMTQVTQTGHHLLTGYAGDACNALLEMHLGKPVVVQHLTEGKRHQRPGILLAYGPRFLFLAHIPVAQKLTVQLGEGDDEGERLNLKWRWQNNQLEIRNLSTYPLLLDQIRLGDVVRDLSMMVAPESAFSLHIERPDNQDIRLFVRVIREADAIVPRSKAVLRYSVDSLKQLPALDVAMQLNALQNNDEEVQRLRQELKQHSPNPAAAARLARTLYESGDLQEAERFYRRALQDARHLPDKGQRVQLELAQLRFYQQDEGDLSS